MEITSATTAAKTNYVTGIEEEEEQQTLETAEENKAIKDTDPDVIMISQKNTYDEESVDEKVKNFIQNILINPKLTESARGDLQRYLQNFDVAKFIKSYGPFESARDISAAMYAVTAGMIKYQDE